jgi:DNA-binding transcriptional ArsR family regulator
MGRLDSLAPDALGLLARRFRVLSEPIRLRILQTLQRGERNVTELTSLLQATQPNVSKQLRVLQESGFIGRRQEGNNAYWFIADSSVFELCDLVCAGLHARLSAHVRLLGRARRG